MFNPKDQKALKAAFLALIPEKDRAYYKTNCSEVVIQLSDGRYLALDKQRIETHFCFGEGSNGVSYDEALDMAEHAATNAGYFLWKNMQDLDRDIKLFIRAIRDVYSDWDIKNYGLYLHSSYVCDKIAKQETTWRTGSNFYCSEPMNRADAMLILRGLWYQRRVFKKRLHAYLKRYGLSKVRAWTYWVDA